ncbi:MAG: hypothetical protein KC503_00940 [Myxococcales bacterium]|nr:hypothetical protein [Myxococcales bacterium]
MARRTLLGRLALLAALGLCALCIVMVLRAGRSDAGPPRPPEQVSGTLRVDPPYRGRGKPFRGVWIVTSKGKLLVSYLQKRPLRYWRDFDGKAVVAHGFSYTPYGQSIRARHFRLTSLTLADTKAARGVVSLGARTSLCGRFELRAMPAGSKRAGKPVRYFVTRRAKRYIARGPHKRGWVRVRGRTYALSPFVAHLGGARLWITDVRSDPSCAKPPPPKWRGPRPPG